MENKLQDPKKIKINDAKVVFYTGPDDDKAAEYGTSLTIALTPAQKKQIEDFCKLNNVGKNGDPKRGIANIKQYTNEETGETTDQYTIKFNEHTKFAGLNGLSQNDLGYNAVVNIIANCYDYNKFGGGTAISASAIVVKQGAASNNDADLEELLNDLGEEAVAEDTSSPIPF